MLKEIKTASEILALVSDLGKMDADKDGRPDLQEHIAAVGVAAPYIIAAKEALEAAQKNIAKVQEIVGDQFGLLEMDIDLVRQRLKL